MFYGFVLKLKSLSNKKHPLQNTVFEKYYFVNISSCTHPLGHNQMVSM
uniref:Uncharacterized protein n=1 Tax=Anguilla anguilla TaxID=7936 RepID=A0A0E9UFS1_ANGAN